VNEFVGFTIAGLVSASIYAITACGLTLTYTTTGIFNWAHGALVAVGAFTYWQLYVGWGVPAPIAALICLLVVGPVIGVVLELLIMHRLEGTSDATRMVATLALFVGLLAGINWIWPPGQFRDVPPLFSGQVAHVFGQRVPYNDLIVMAVGIAVAVSLRLLLHRTRAGVEMRATVDDRTLTSLNGASVKQAAMRSWAIGSTLAVLAGILISTRGALDATALALLIVNAFAAAVIGRLRSLPMTVVGALIIGLLDAYGHGYLATSTFAGVQYLQGLVNVTPVVVLFVALLFIPQTRLRGNRQLRVKEVSTPPTWAGTAVLAGAVLLLTIALTPLLAVGDLNQATKIWGLSIVGLSLVPLIGYAGRLSVCQLSFAAIGAIIVSHLGQGGNPIFLGIAALICAVLGALVALPTLRLSGLYLALATAAFALAVDGWIFRLPPFSAVIRVPFTSWTLYRERIEIFQGGNLNVTRFRLAGVSVASDHAYMIFGAVAFSAMLFVVVAVRRSDFGLRLIALKDSPVASATLGMNQRVTVLAVFALSAAMAGFGGAIYGAAIQRPSPDPFAFVESLSVLLVMVIAGINSPGAAIGAGLFLGGPTLINLFPSLGQLSSTAIGAQGVAVGQNPNGAIPNERSRWQSVAQTRIVLVAMLVVLVAAYLLRITDVIDNWTFVASALAIVVATRLTAAHAVKTQRADASTHADARSHGLSAPPELLGLVVPYTARDVDALERHLKLTGVHVEP
jgi:branched-chain amino acid transport system permease protein